MRTGCVCSGWLTPRLLKSRATVSARRSGPPLPLKAASCRPLRRTSCARNDCSKPLYYIVPPQWKDVIAVLNAHGLRLQRLVDPATIEVESYRFSEAKWAAAPFEGRVMPTFKTNLVREKRLFPAGSVLVPLAQPAAHVIMHLLEPQAPDSLAAWGFFNAVFEQKEYGEDYVLEKLAREMMAKDEALRREFEQRLMNDPKFAASSRERLRFFYERSPYWDPQLNLYPVGRIVSTLDLKLKDF